MPEHSLDKNEVETLATERFGKGVRLLNKVEASGLIDELLDTYGGNSRPHGNNNRYHPQPAMHCSWCQFKNECLEWLRGMTVADIHRKDAA